MSKWIVDIKGAPEQSPFEISVLRDDNKHGKESYGWFKENKILISNSGGPCRNSLRQSVWDRLVSVAEIVAEMMNNEEQDEKAGTDRTGGA